MCAGLPGRVRRPRRPPLPRPAQRLPGLRPAALHAGRRGGRAARRRPDPGGQGDRRVPPGVPGRRRGGRWRGCGRASTARTGRSRSWRRTSQTARALADFEDERLLLSPARPIVLAREKRDCPLSLRRAWRPGVARARRDAALHAAAPPARRGGDAGDDVGQRQRRADRLPGRGRAGAAGAASPTPSCSTTARSTPARTTPWCAPGAVLRRSRGYVPGALRAPGRPAAARGRRRAQEHVLRRQGRPRVGRATTSGT